MIDEMMRFGRLGNGVLGEWEKGGAVGERLEKRAVVIFH
jgi:hypothetical protein